MEPRASAWGFSGPNFEDRAGSRVAAARVPRLKPGVQGDRRSAARTGDSGFFPTGESGEHQQSDEP